MKSSIAERREQIRKFDFRHIHEQVLFGTASDRFAGWVGTVYDSEWESKVRTRKKRTGGVEITERVLPVESVRQYFEHFSILELDFTFYRPLLQSDGKPSPNLATLEKYALYSPDHARFFVKVPQAYSSRNLRRNDGMEVVYHENPTYLSADRCRDFFLKPLESVLGNRVAGLLFQQEYVRFGETDPDQHSVDLAHFVTNLNSPYPLHMEIRSPHLLTGEFFDFLADSGTGYVFSHWTWLPTIKKQWYLSGQQFTSFSDDVFVRLISPRGMSYQAAFQHAFPFEGPVPALAGLEQTKTMIDETVALIFKALAGGKHVHIIANNRAYGSSPFLAQAVARRFLDFADRFGA